MSDPTGPGEKNMLSPVDQRRAKDTMWKIIRDELLNLISSASTGALNSVDNPSGWVNECSRNIGPSNGGI